MSAGKLKWLGVTLYHSESKILGSAERNAKTLSRLVSFNFVRNLACLTHTGSSRVSMVFSNRKDVGTVSMRQMWDSERYAHDDSSDIGRAIKVFQK